MNKVLEKIDIMKGIQRQCLLLDIHSEALRAKPYGNTHFLNRSIEEIRETLSNFLVRAEKLGLSKPSKTDISKIVETPEYQAWAEPKTMGEVLPVPEIQVAVSMRDIKEDMSRYVDIPLRKAMSVLIEKGWITDYSSGNYNDASGTRFNMFVDRKNVAFIRFDKNKLKAEDKRHLMKGNFGEYMLYTEIDPFIPVSTVENELFEMAKKLPHPSYNRSSESER